MPSVARSIADPRRSNDVNVNGTVELVLAAAAAGRSSCGARWLVVGLRLIRRAAAAGGPAYRIRGRRTPRASSLPSTTSTRSVRRAGSRSVVLRYFNVFGPGQDPMSEYAAVVPRFVTAALAGRAAGRLRRWHAVTRLHVHRQRRRGELSRQPSGRASPEGPSTSAAVAGSRSASCSARSRPPRGRPIDPEFRPGRQGDVPHSQADISAAREHLGYEPVIGFAEGIRRSVAWYAEQAADVHTTA